MDDMPFANQGSDEETGDTAPLLPKQRVKSAPQDVPDQLIPNMFGHKPGSREQNLSFWTDKSKAPLGTGKNIITEIPVNVILKKNNDGKSMLQVAIGNLNLDDFKAIIYKADRLLIEKDKNGETPLHYIVKGDFLEALKVSMPYLSQNDVNICDKKNTTPVHLAVMNNNVRMLKLLIEHGGRVMAKTQYMYTALHFAAKKGFNKCVEIIVKAVKDDDKKKLMNATAKDNSTALMFAAAGGHSACCSFLTDTNVNMQDKDGNTALHHAARKGFSSTVKLLVENFGAEVSVPNKKGETPLHCAASNRNELCLTYLLERSHKIENPEKVLVIAVQSKCKNSVEKLLSRKDVRDSINNVLRNGNTVLHVSLSLQYAIPDITRLLLRHGADKTIANDRMEYPLHLAAQQRALPVDSDEDDRLEMCKDILKESHNLVNKLNKDKQNPLFLAAKSGNIVMIHSLLQKGAKVIDENSALTAVHVAAKYGHNDIMVVLLRSLDAKQLDELSSKKPHPLHIAAEQGHLTCCKTLLKRGKSSMKDLDDDDHNAIDLAFRNKRKETFLFLLNQMPFDNSLTNYGSNIHSYFKEAVEDKNEEILDAIIESSWCCVVFDQTYCLGEGMTREARKSLTIPQLLNNQKKYCSTLVNLAKVLPRTASRALDRHIIRRPDGSTVCNYTPFEFIYYKLQGHKKTSPFICSQNKKNDGKSPEEKEKAKRTESKQKTKTKGGGDQTMEPSAAHLTNQEKKSQDKIEAMEVSDKKHCSLAPDAKELDGTLWGKHPLLHPDVTKRKEILNHKLTKSWMEFRVHKYTKSLFVAYVLVFGFIALVTTATFSCLWNTYHLEARFNGTSRADIASVYSSIYSSGYNVTVDKVVEDIRYQSYSDANCSQYSDPAQQSSETPVIGSGAWNRSVCVITHLEETSTGARLTQYIMFITYCLFFMGNVYMWHPTKKIGMTWFHSTRYSLLICLPVIFIPISKCDLYLNLRPDLQWQFGVLAVLVTWLTTATAMNNVFAIFATITKHFIYNYILTMLPVFLIMYGFALAFHLLLTVEGGAVTTIFDTISKTFLWILDEFDHKDIFRQKDPDINFPTTGKLLYVMYGIVVGGLLFNLILMNTGDNLRNMKRKVNLDRNRASLKRLILADILYPRRRRRHAQCHVTHSSECDHFNSEEGHFGMNTMNNSNVVSSSSICYNHPLHNFDSIDENDPNRQLEQMMQMKKDIRDILKKVDEMQTPVSSRA